MFTLYATKSQEHVLQTCACVPLFYNVIQFSGSEPLLVYKMAYENVIPQLSNPTSILHNLLPYEVIERSDSIEPFSVGQIKGRTRMHALLGILHVIFQDRPCTNLAED